MKQTLFRKEVNMKKRSGLLIVMSIVVLIFGIYGLSKVVPVLSQLNTWGWSLTAFSGISNSDLTVVYALIIFSLIFYCLMLIAGIAGFVCNNKKTLIKLSDLLAVLSIILLIISIVIKTFGFLDVFYVLTIIAYNEGAGFCIQNDEEEKAAKSKTK